MEKNIPKVSLVLLTFNRLEYVKQSVEHNIKNAGYPIYEIIWIDNGSDKDLRDYMLSLKFNVSILHGNNRGVAKGYNEGYKMATGDLICKPGTDMIMPDNWLKEMVNGFRTEETGMIGILNVELDILPERILGKAKKGLIEAKTIGSQLIKKEVFEKVGYLPETYGLYGWDDIDWDEKVRKQFKTYYLTDYKSKHLCYLDNTDYKDYQAFKLKEINN